MYDAPVKVIKQANGRYRWFGVSSVNTIDRDNEIVSESALMMDVHRTKMFSDDSVLLFFHLDGNGDYDKVRLGGAPDYRSIVDGHLIESGEFDDTVIGRGFAKFIADNPQGLDGKGFGMSIGFDGMPDANGIYHLIQIKERSVLPLSEAANPFTSFGVKGIVKMAFNERQLEGLERVKELAKDPETLEAVKMILAASDQSKQLAQSGVVRKAADSAPVQTPSAQIFPLQFNQPGNYKVQVDATPSPAQLGFETKQTKQTEEEVAAVAAAANLEVASNAVAQAAAAVSEVVAAATEAAPTDTPVEEVKTEDVPEEEVTDEEKARLRRAPRRIRKEDGTEEEVTDSALTDDDLSEIVKYVDERISQKLAEHMAAMEKMTGEIAKMVSAVDKVEKAADAIDLVQKLNTQPVKSIADRLKSLSVASGNAQPAPETNPLVQKQGENLEADNAHMSDIQKQLGFK